MLVELKVRKEGRSPYARINGVPAYFKLWDADAAKLRSGDVAEVAVVKQTLLSELLINRERRERPDFVNARSHYSLALVNTLMSLPNTYMAYNLKFIKGAYGTAEVTFDDGIKRTVSLRNTKVPINYDMTTERSIVRFLGAHTDDGTPIVQLVGLTELGSLYIAPPKKRGANGNHNTIRPEDAPVQGDV